MRAVTEIDVNRLSQIERINVIGASGSGKSTVGRQLAALLGLPYIELDFGQITTYCGLSINETTICSG